MSCICLYLGNFCWWHNCITRSGCEDWELFGAFFCPWGVSEQPSVRSPLVLFRYVGAFSWGGGQLLLVVPTSLFVKELCQLPLHKPAGCYWKGKDSVALLLLWIVMQSASIAPVCFPQQHHNANISLIPVSPFSAVWMLVIYVKCFSNFPCSDECLYESNWDWTGSVQAKKDDAVVVLFTEMWEVVFINIS